MRYTLIALLFLLVACVAPVQEGVLEAEGITTDNVYAGAAVDLCEGVACRFNERCEKGTCACASGFKRCGDACIPESGCCVEGDCGEGRYCFGNVCKSIPGVCDFNEEVNEKTGECDCVAGTTYCGVQDKCIPEKSCCIRSDCNRINDECALTSFASNVCLRHPLLSCKTMLEGRSERFTTASGEVFSIKLEDVREGGISHVVVNEELLKVPGGAQLKIASGVTLIVDEVRTFGGTCKDLP